MRAIENVDEMAFDVEKSEFEGCEQPAGARANDDDIGGDLSAHFQSPFDTGTAWVPDLVPSGCVAPLVLMGTAAVTSAPGHCPLKASNMLHLA